MEFMSDRSYPGRLRKESFPNRVVNMWNFLPEHVVNAPSVDSSKNRLDKQWSNEEIDYKAAAPAGRKIFAPAGTRRSDHLLGALLG